MPESHLGSSALVGLQARDCSLHTVESLVAESQSGSVSLHAIGVLTDSVFRFVGPATEALGLKGQKQVVLAMEDPAHRHLVHAFAPHVQVIALPWSANPMKRWGQWSAMLVRISEALPVGTVHMHGFLPSLVVAPLMMRKSRISASLVYTPHDSRAEYGQGWGHRLVRTVFKPWLAGLPRVSLVSLASEVEALARRKGPRPEVLETPVDRAYLEVIAARAHQPLVLGGVYDEPSASAIEFSQLAVLLGNGDAGLAFNWIGPADDESKHRLNAAEVGVFTDRDPAKRASRLAGGWVFLCPSITHGFPGHLVEAMACGTPVVAIDCPRHRDLIDDGRTGFLCSSREDLVRQVLQLIADPALRATVGAAGRAEARLRFTAERFRQVLMQHYPEETASGVAEAPRA